MSENHRLLLEIEIRKEEHIKACQKVDSLEAEIKSLESEITRKDNALNYLGFDETNCRDCRRNQETVKAALATARDCGCKGPGLPHVHSDVPAREEKEDKNG